MKNTKNGKVDTVSADDIDRTDKRNIVLEDDNPVNLPDVGKILSQIMSILECMTHDDMLALKEKNRPAFVETMEQKFPEFSERYYAVFQKVISGEDITPLFRMLAGIDRVNRKEATIEEVEEKIGTALANQYVIPVLNKNKKNNK